MPRYGRVEDVIRLALELQGTTVGLSLDQIGEMFGVSRRTSERMLNAVRRVYPQLEGRILEDGKKYWRHRGSAARALVSWKPEELAALDTAAKLADRDGLEDEAGTLQLMSAKLRSVADLDGGVVEGTDVEAMLQTEGIAIRPGPRVRIKPEIPDRIRRAMLACRQIRIVSADEPAGLQLAPYGFLLGQPHHLVGRNPDADEIRMIELWDIDSVEILEAPYDRPPSFELHSFAQSAFGMERGTPVDVVWRFQPEAARAARAYQFHPEQATEEQPDGSLMVRFRASGLREMAYHLFRWGDAAEVVEPTELREELVRGLRQALSVYSAH